MLPPCSRYYSFCSVSYNRSVASSKASSPQRAIYCFIFQFPVFSRIPKVLQYLLTSSSSFSVTSILPTIFRSLMCFEGSSYAICDTSSKPFFFLLYAVYSSPPWLYVILLPFSHVLSNWSVSPAQHFKTSLAFPIYFPKWPLSFLSALCHHSFGLVINP